MTKKLLIVSFVLMGLTIVTIGAWAQEATLTQPTPPTPTPTAPDALAPLLPQPTAGSSTVPEINLRPGTKSPHVVKLQRALKSLGHLPADLETTENFGPRTREAIRQFQQSKGLPATGFFGPATRASLKNTFKEREAMGVVIDKNVDIACMRIAVEKRENALVIAHDTFSQKVKTAREIRRTDLLAAWSIQDPKERHAAVKVAWNKYRESVKTARTEQNQSEKTIWSQFTQDAKRCRASAVEKPDLEKVETDD